MTTIPLIASADDVPGAVRHAQREVGARWYVARRAESLGRGDLVPSEWGITAAAAPVDRERLTRRQARGKMGHMEPITAAGPDWSPDLHPRDRKGRFIEKFDLINIFSVEGGSIVTARGRAVGNSKSAGGEDFVHVEISDGPSKGKTLKVPVSKVESAPPAKGRLDAADAADVARRNELQDPQFKDRSADQTTAETDAKIAHRLAAREAGDDRSLSAIDTDFYASDEGKAFKAGDGPDGPQPVDGDSDRLVLNGKLYEHDGEGWKYNTKDEKLGPKDAEPEVVGELDAYRDERRDGVQPTEPGLDTAFEGTEADRTTMQDFLRGKGYDDDVIDSLTDDELRDDYEAEGGQNAPARTDLNVPADAPSREEQERFLTEDRGYESDVVAELTDDELYADFEAEGGMNTLENDPDHQSDAAQDFSPAADQPYGPAPEDLDQEAWDAANNHNLMGLDPVGEDRNTFQFVADSEGVDFDELVRAADYLNSENADANTPEADAPAPEVPDSSGYTPSVQAKIQSRYAAMSDQELVDEYEFQRGEEQDFLGSKVEGAQLSKLEFRTDTLRDGLDKRGLDNKAARKGQVSKVGGNAPDAEPNGPADLAANYGSGSLAGNDDGSVSLSQTAREDLGPFGDFLDIDTNDGGWASGLSSDQFQSLMDYHESYTEDPESVPSWASEKLDDLEAWADKYDVDPFDAMDARKRAMELGWSQEEQLRNVLNGDPLDEQNPNALRNIANYLRNNSLSSTSFNPEDPDAITTAELASDIDGFLEDFGYDGPSGAGPEIDPETGEPLNDSQVRGQAITDQANEILTDSDAQRAFEDWSSAVVVESETPEAGWDTVQKWLDIGQQRYNERNARGDWRANDPAEAEAEGRAQIEKYGQGIGGKENLEIEAIGDPRDYDFGAFQVWEVNPAGRGGRGTFPTREAAQAFIDGYNEEWDANFGSGAASQPSPGGGSGAAGYPVGTQVSIKGSNKRTLNRESNSFTGEPQWREPGGKVFSDDEVDSLIRENGARVFSKPGGANSDLVDDIEADDASPGSPSMDSLSDGDLAELARRAGEASPEAGNTPESASDVSAGSEAPAGTPATGNAADLDRLLLMARSAEKGSVDWNSTDAGNDIQALVGRIESGDLDRESGHKELAGVMTRLKLGGKQRKRYRELLDSYLGDGGGDSAKIQAGAVADNLSDSNPVKEKLKAKASGAAAGTRKADDAAEPAAKPGKPPRTTEQMNAERDTLNNGELSGTGYDVKELLNIRNVTLAEIEESERKTGPDWTPTVTVKPPGGTEISVTTDLARRELGLPPRSTGKA